MLKKEIFVVGQLVYRQKQNTKKGKEGKGRDHKTIKVMFGARYINTVSLDY